MNFEYNSHKSYTNKIKHGIDFEEAKELWQDGDLLVAPLKHLDEARWICIGKIDQKHYSAIVTYRGEFVRIISVRRSRKEEVAQYESKRD